MEVKFPAEFGGGSSRKNSGGMGGDEAPTTMMPIVNPMEFLISLLILPKLETAWFLLHARLEKDFIAQPHMFSLGLHLWKLTLDVICGN